jgi:biotin operon repressor
MPVLIVARSLVTAAKPESSMKPVSKALEISKRVIDAENLIAQREAELTKAEENLAVARAERQQLLNEFSEYLADDSVPTISDRVVQLLRSQSGSQFSADAVADALGGNVNSIRSILSRLKSEGKIYSLERGYYTAPPPARAGNLVVLTEEEHQAAAQAVEEDSDVPF